MNARRFGRVDDLGHVLAGQVEDVGVVVLVEELLDLGREGALLGRELEVHGFPSCAGESDEASGPADHIIGRVRARLRPATLNTCAAARAGLTVPPRGPHPAHARRERLRCAATVR